MTDSADRVVDVREIEGEPFGDIVAALDALSRDEVLEIVAPFEPVPLYGQLEQRGFEHETEEDEGLYRVRVRHVADADAQ